MPTEPGEKVEHMTADEPRVDSVRAEDREEARRVCRSLKIKALRRERSRTGLGNVLTG